MLSKLFGCHPQPFQKLVETSSKREKFLLPRESFEIYSPQHSINSLISSNTNCTHPREAEKWQLSHLRRILPTHLERITTQLIEFPAHKLSQRLALSGTLALIALIALIGFLSHNSLIGTRGAVHIFCITPETRLNQKSIVSRYFKVQSVCLTFAARA